MTRWSRDVFRWIRPHHIIRTIQDPDRAKRELKYRFTFTTKNRLLTDITNESNKHVENIFKELRQKKFSLQIRNNVSLQSCDSGRGAMGDEVELLYGFIRLIKPQQKYSLHINNLNPDCVPRFLTGIIKTTAIPDNSF